MSAVFSEQGIRSCITAGAQGGAFEIREVNVSGAQCRFLIVQGPGKYDFVRLAKLDGR